jgi:alanine-glyoxylate transaminase / serine-glyoxylate transaminase / serine-pyruvate transaminase
MIHNPPGTRPRLMIPGPCQVSAEVLRTYGRPVSAHHGPEWAAAHEETLTLVRRLVNAPWAYLLPGTGSVAIEAAVANQFRPGQRVVVPDTGYFGRRLVEVAKACGLEVDELAVHPGHPVDPRTVAGRLGGADGVLMVHVETSTGVRHPVEEVAEHTRRAGAAIVVDAVSSIGGEWLDLEASGIDAIAAASQKGLGCPPGLGVVALSERGHRRLRDVRPPSWYLDLARWDRERREVTEFGAPHPVTMPTNLVLALAASLGSMMKQGVRSWCDERAEVAAHCRARLAEMGLVPLAAADHQASLVVVAKCHRPGELRERALRRANIAITGGMAPVPDAIRIGLMGANGTLEMVDELMAALA